MTLPSRNFDPIRCVLVAAGALLGCGTPELPHHVLEYDIHRSQSVELENLPRGSRVVREERGKPGLVLASNVEGSVTIDIAYSERERMDDGERSVPHPVKESWDVSIQAPGYMPRLLHLTIPGPAKVDAHLDGPGLFPVAGTRGKHEALDRGIERRLSGRCAESTAALKTAAGASQSDAERARITALASDCRESTISTALAPSTWKPESVGVAPAVASLPEAGLRAIVERATEEKDASALRGARAMVGAVSAGRLDDAARLATLLADPLPSDLAAVVLRLPAGILAEARLRTADHFLSGQDSRLAMELANEARSVDPLVTPAIFDKILKARTERLRAQAIVEQKNGHPLMARAYWLALRSIRPEAVDAREGLVATEVAATDSVRVRLALSSDGGEDIAATLGTLLGKSLPRHVGVVGKGDSPTALLSYAVSEPARTHHVSQIQRSKKIVAFTVTKPNPDYANAQEELQSANQRMGEAQNEYQEFHQQAEAHRQNAAAGGIPGAIEAAAAVASEAAGQAILSSARGDIAKAEEALRKTPRTLQEAVEQVVEFPVLLLETQATMRLVFRLDGFGKPVEDSADATAHATEESVVASPGIGVDGKQANVDSLAKLTPDLGEALAGVTKRMTERIRAAEEGDAWQTFVAARDRGTVDQAAVGAVMYLAATEDAGPHSREVIQFLQRRLP